MATKTKQWPDGSSATIQYGGQGNDEIIITSDANEHYESRSMQITVGTTDGSGISRIVTIQQAAKQRIDLSAAVVTAATQTYSGSAKTPTPTVTLNGSTVPSSGYDVTYNNNTNAGTANITITGKGDYTGVAYGTFTINKANPTYTAPSARSLTYSGSAQYLTTTGSTSHGTIQYSSDGTNWYSTRRQGTNAGGYTTYWRLVGDSNHNDVASTSISVTIAQATGSVTTAPTARDVTYTGSSQYLVTSGSGTGTMYYRYKLSTSSSWSLWSTTRPSRTDAGTYNIEYYAAASSDGNYTQSATGSLNVEMKKATSSVTAAPTAKSLTYSGSAQALVNAGTASGGTMYYKYTTTNSKPTSTSGFSSSIPTRTTAGTYYVWYYVYGDSNHTSTSISITAVSVTIAKKSRTMSWSSYPSSLYVGRTGTLSATASAGSSDGTISYSSSNSSKASVSGSTVTAVASGTCTIYASISEGTNYLSASTSYTLTVKAIPSGYVDMGVSVLWAEKNIGSSSIYSYDCNFFSWGNIDGHSASSGYDWGTSISTEPYKSSSGAALRNNIGNSYDAAYQNLGSPNRMPTATESQELINNTKCIDANGIEITSSDKRTTVNGVVGLYLESKINGNRLFFPCSGVGSSTSRYYMGVDGFYWLSTYNNAWDGTMLYITNTGVYPNYKDLGRYYGCAIRAVQPI